MCDKGQRPGTRWMTHGNEHFQMKMEEVKGETTQELFSEILLLLFLPSTPLFLICFFGLPWFGSLLLDFVSFAGRLKRICRGHIQGDLDA